MPREGRQRTGVGRRELMQLGGITAATLLLRQIMIGHLPIGTDVGSLPTVAAIRQDRSSPSTVNAQADVTVIVFTDYQCPACRLSDAALQAAVRRDGEVKIVYKEWPVFGPRSEQAARVALASTYQGIYPAVHAALMRATLDESALRQAVVACGGDWSRIETDLELHRAEIDAELARNATQAFSLGLDGTPAYLIGPILVKGGLTESEFARVLDAGRRADRRGSNVSRADN